MAKLTLKDVARYSDTLTSEELMANQDMQDYVMEMQEVGAEVLKNLSSKEISVAISFMSAVFSYQTIQDNPMLGLLMMSQSNDITMSMLQSLKFAVGIILSEEWR